MIKRVYQDVIDGHFRENRQMAFLSGPRQVGKTTTSRQSSDEIIYVNWDKREDREAILRGEEWLTDRFGLNALENRDSRIVFDEIHKYSKWKKFLKGFFDGSGESFKIVVTGSARLNIYKRGGDSLMGRYFLYRMHPLSVAELVGPASAESEIGAPKGIDPTGFEQLFRFGGFPEPFLKNHMRFFNRWKRLRLEQFFKEDLRDLTSIQEIGQIELLAEILRAQVGQLLNYSHLARAIDASVDSIRRWISTLEQMYLVFRVRPWFRNVPKSLRKQPKIFYWDWSVVSDEGARRENMIASHLLKAVHFWTDIGLGDYGLYYLRDKTKREVDFLITKNEAPWILVEVKTTDNRRISPHLHYFGELHGIQHAFQVNFSSNYVDRDCFEVGKPVIVPASTFLSQLV